MFEFECLRRTIRNFPDMFTAVLSVFRRQKQKKNKKTCISLRSYYYAARSVRNLKRMIKNKQNIKKNPRENVSRINTINSWNSGRIGNHKKNSTTIKMGLWSQNSGEPLLWLLVLYSAWNQRRPGFDWVLFIV